MRVASVTYRNVLFETCPPTPQINARTIDGGIDSDRTCTEGHDLSSRAGPSMTIRTFWLACTALVFPALASAQPVNGLYVSGGASANFLQNEIVTGAPGLSRKR